jgi:hypothetical protein
VAIDGKIRAEADEGDPSVAGLPTRPILEDDATASGGAGKPVAPARVTFPSAVALTVELDAG